MRKPFVTAVIILNFLLTICCLAYLSVHTEVLKEIRKEIREIREMKGKKDGIHSRASDFRSILH